jgi:hypothetical protein
MTSTCESSINKESMRYPSESLGICLIANFNGGDKGIAWGL